MNWPEGRRKARAGFRGGFIGGVGNSAAILKGVGVVWGDVMPIVFGDESAKLFFPHEHPVPSELLKGSQPCSFGLFGVGLLRTFCLRERHFLLGCLTINDHHFHPTTTATASAIPAAVPPTAAGMEIAAACSVLVVGVAVLEFVEIVTSPIVLEVR